MIEKPLHSKPCILVQIIQLDCRSPNLGLVQIRQQGLKPTPDILILESRIYPLKRNAELSLEHIVTVINRNDIQDGEVKSNLNFVPGG